MILCFEYYVPLILPVLMIHFKSCFETFLTEESGNREGRKTL